MEELKRKLNECCKMINDDDILSNKAKLYSLKKSIPGLVEELMDYLERKNYYNRKDMANQVKWYIIDPDLNMLIFLNYCGSNSVCVMNEKFNGLKFNGVNKQGYVLAKRLTSKELCSLESQIECRRYDFRKWAMSNIDLKYFINIYEFNVGQIHKQLFTYYSNFYDISEVKKNLYKKKNIEIVKSNDEGQNKINELISKYELKPIENYGIGFGSDESYFKYLSINDYMIIENIEKNLNVIRWVKICGSKSLDFRRIYFDGNNMYACLLDENYNFVYRNLNNDNMRDFLSTSALPLEIVIDEDLDNKILKDILFMVKDVDRKYRRHDIIFFMRIILEEPKLLELSNIFSLTYSEINHYYLHRLKLTDSDNFDTWLGLTKEQQDLVKNCKLKKLKAIEYLKTILNQSSLSNVDLKVIEDILYVLEYLKESFMDFKKIEKLKFIEDEEQLKDVLFVLKNLISKEEDELIKMYLDYVYLYVVFINTPDFRLDLNIDEIEYQFVRLMDHIKIVDPMLDKELAIKLDKMKNLEFSNSNYKLVVIDKLNKLAFRLKNQMKTVMEIVNDDLKIVFIDENMQWNFIPFAAVEIDKNNVIRSFYACGDHEYFPEIEYPNKKLRNFIYSWAKEKGLTFADNIKL